MEDGEGPDDYDVGIPQDSESDFNSVVINQNNSQKILLKSNDKNGRVSIRSDSKIPASAVKAKTEGAEAPFEFENLDLGKKKQIDVNRIDFGE